jgi:Tfp pilus assembly protein PilF
LYRFFIFLMTILLASCAVIEQKQPEEPQQIIETSTHSAWRLSDSERRSVSSNRAVAQLLTQADNLIAEEHFAQATDKLERLVRIEPRFAQAWSRLSWMALKNGDAERSRQMAQRSNSYSRDNNQLTLLNWHFIKNAGELLGNNDIIQQAEKMITTLGVR